jgi:hypothetical protein
MSGDRACAERSLLAMSLAGGFSRLDLNPQSSENEIQSHNNTQLQGGIQVENSRFPGFSEILPDVRIPKSRSERSCCHDDSAANQTNDTQFHCSKPLQSRWQKSRWQKRARVIQNKIPGYAQHESTVSHFIEA